MARSIQTSLLGKMARITVGLTTDQIADRRSHPMSCDSQFPLWKHLGECGEIVAIVWDGDDFIVALNVDGQVVQVALKYVSLS